MANWRFKIEESYVDRTWNVTGALIADSGRISEIQPLVVQDRDPGMKMQPFLSAPDPSLIQAFVDAAAEAGIYPTGRSIESYKGQIRATEAHLADMRKLVAHTLKLPDGLDAPKS